MPIWIEQKFSEKNIMSTLLTIGLLFFGLMIVLTVYDCFNKSDFEQLSNWFQAFIAIWTLLAVIYTAKKAYLVSEKSNKISINSSIITERAYMNEVISKLIFKANDEFNKHLDYLENINKIQKENGHNDWFEIPKDDKNKLERSLISYIYYICCAVSSANDVKYDRKNDYYISLIGKYMDYNICYELENENILKKTLVILNKLDINYGERSIQNDYENLREFNFSSNMYWNKI